MVVVSQKLDVNQPEDDTDLYAHVVTLDRSDLTYSPVQKLPFVLGSNLPSLPADPQGLAVLNYNFDFGLKFNSSNFPLLKPLKALVGGDKTKVELELRARAGAQDGDPSFTGLPYESVGFARLEAKLGVKLIDIFTLAAYLQGTFVYGGEEKPGAPIQLLGGRVTLGLQGKIEYPFTPAKKISILGQEFDASIGLVADIRFQFNLSIDSKPANQSPEDDLFSLINLVRADGTPALIGDDPSQLGWQLNLGNLAPLIIGGLSSQEAQVLGEIAPLALSDGTDAAIKVQELASIPLEVGANAQLSPGIGIFAKVKATDFFEAKASGIAYFDFFRQNRATDWSFSNFRQRFDAEVRLGYFTVRYRQEFVQTIGSEEFIEFGSKQLGYNPIQGSGGVYGDNPILGDAVSRHLTNDGPVDLAVSADGTLLMAWVQDAPNDSGDFGYVVVSESKDNGSTWSTPTQIPGSAGLNLDPVVEVDSQGKAVVTWNQGNAAALVNQPPGQAYVVFGGKT